MMSCECHHQHDEQHEHDEHHSCDGHHDHGHGHGPEGHDGHHEHGHHEHEHPGSSGHSHGHDGAGVTVGLPLAEFLEDVRALVPVQPESTLSRTVLRKPGLRVVAFSFDEGQQLTEHTAAMPVLLIALSGSFTVVADGDSHTLVPGGLLYLETRAPHAVTAREPAQLGLIMLDQRAKPLLPTPQVRSEQD